MTLDAGIRKQIDDTANDVRDIRLLLGGDPSYPDRPGIVTDVAHLKSELYGNGITGLKTKVNTMWRIHVWLLCTISGGVGFMVHRLFISL